MKNRTVEQILKEFEKDGVAEGDIFNCHDCNRHYVRQEINHVTSNVVEEEACGNCGGAFCEDCFDHTEYADGSYFCKKCAVTHGKKAVNE